MNRKLLVSLLFLVSSFGYALELSPGLRWNLGTAEFCLNHVTPTGNGKWSLDDTNLSFLDFQHGVTLNRPNDLGVETSVAQVRSRKEQATFSVLPMTIYYNFLVDQFAALGIYGRAEWQMSSLGNRAYYATGVRSNLFVIDDPNRLFYSWKSSVYLEFDSQKEVSLGIQLDLGSVFILFTALNTGERPPVKP